MRVNKRYYNEGAYSTKTGMIFNSSLDDRQVICENGNISISIKRKNKYEYIILFICLIAFLYCSLGLCIEIEKSNNYDMFLITGLTIIIMLILFILFCYVRYKLKDIVLQYHGAEHKVINACNDLERIPTLSEIKTYSRISPTCGTNMALVMLMGLFIVGLLFISLWSSLSYKSQGIPNIYVVFIIYLLFGISFGIYLSFVYKNSKNELNIFQYLTTLEPTDEQLLVAINGMKVWEDLEISSLPDKSVLEDVSKISISEASNKYKVSQQVIKRWMFWYEKLSNDSE